MKDKNLSCAVMRRCAVIEQCGLCFINVQLDMIGQIVGLSRGKGVERFTSSNDNRHLQRLGVCTLQSLSNVGYALALCIYWLDGMIGLRLSYSLKECSSPRRDTSFARASATTCSHESYQEMSLME